jgi:ABC-2 type transport system permease protein
MFNRTLRGFLKKEFTQALRDPKMRAILFLAPMVQLTLFGIALSNEVKNIRLAAAYAPSDTLTRQIQDHAIASGWFVAPRKLTGVDPFEWLRSGETDAVIVAPPQGLQRQIAIGKGQLQLLINSTNVLRAQAVENYLKALTLEVLPKAPKGPIDFDERILYNPMLTTSYFMVPGVMGLLLAVVTIIMTSMSIAKEREEGTLETLISAPVETWEVILGKSIPYVVLGLVQLLLILVVAIAVFGVPFRGPLILVLLSGFFYICTTVSIGVLISTISKSQQQAMLGGFLFLFPAILFSGLMFPLENMPMSLSWIAFVNPVAHFTYLMRNILLKGGDFEFVLYHLSALAVIAVGLVTVSFRRFRTSLQ